MWHYRELISCPVVLAIGKFSYGDITGFVMLPILNFRVSILISSDGKQRVVSNAPNREWFSRSYRVCNAIMSGSIDSLDSLEKVEASSMMYGGIGIYSLVEGNVACVSLDYVNTRSLNFYLAPVDYISTDYCTEAGLDNWVMLQLAFRTGISRILGRVCTNMFGSYKGGCTIRSSHGLLYITEHKSPPSEDYIRVVPDNNPLRHVLALTTGS